MRQEITRFAPHQNAKVLALLVAIGSLVFVLPFMLWAQMVMPDGMGPSSLMILLFPFIYLVVGYLVVLTGCAVYNTLVRYTGGLTFESAAPRADD